MLVCPIQSLGKDISKILSGTRISFEGTVHAAKLSVHTIRCMTTLCVAHTRISPPISNLSAYLEHCLSKLRGSSIKASRDISAYIKSSALLLSFIHADLDFHIRPNDSSGLSHKVCFIHSCLWSHKPSERDLWPSIPCLFRSCVFPNHLDILLWFSSVLIRLGRLCL